MKCPNCQSTRIRKHGFYRDKQRYQCKDCARQFVETYSPNLPQKHSTGVEDRIERYIQSVSTPASDLLLDLQAATAGYPLAPMQPTMAQARSIAMLIAAMGATRVLELGIFSGYTTLAMALALPAGGRLVCSGVAGQHLDIVRDRALQAGVADKIDWRVGSGLELLDESMAAEPIEKFDLILIAGLKHQYPLYYRRAIELLRPQGLLVATDVLWQGRVLEPDRHQDEFTQGIATFNRELAADGRVDVSILPIGDGLSIALKLS